MITHANDANPNPDLDL